MTMPAKKAAPSPGVDVRPWQGCDMVQIPHDWQQRRETPDERQALLDGLRRNLRERTLAHLRAGKDAVLVLATPPGTGKSTAVAALGDPAGAWRLNLAWIAERHDMAEQVVPLGHYQHIRKCDADTCPTGYHQHQALLERGLPTWAFHLRHQCSYAKQFTQATSAFYQLAHVHTSHPTKHPDGIVIDELNLTSWLEPYEVTSQRLLEAEWTTAEGSPSRRLLDAALCVLHDARLARTELHGRTLFEALAAHLDGDVLGVLDALRDEPSATVRYPAPDRLGLDIDLDAPDAPARLRRIPTRVLAHLWHGLAAEADAFQQGAGGVQWNSRLRVGPGRDKSGAWTLYLTTPRALRTDAATASALPPRIVLDGTADLHYLRRLLPDTAIAAYRMRVPDDLPPPPGMRHIAFRLRTRTGGVKRYSKSSLTGPSGREGLERAIAEVAWVLDRLDADVSARRAGAVGLITFQECEAAIGDALDIPPDRRGHFWAMRGSNAFAACAVLLVVGRPALNEEAIFRMGSVLYAGHGEPLTPGMEQVADKTFHYRDARLERLALSITQAELTQCAHRNRPLIYDQRTVVTFCDEEIAYLPVTTLIHKLAHCPMYRSVSGASGDAGDAGDAGDDVAGNNREANDADDDHDVMLERAAALVCKWGARQSVRMLRTALVELFGHGLRNETIMAWHRAHPSSAASASVVPGKPPHSAHAA